jgi:pimeloyl-ACP methyl ester carboxylesterase
MELDFELYRRDVIVSHEPDVRLSVIDVQPERPQATLVLVHGFGGNAMQWRARWCWLGTRSAGRWRPLSRIDGRSE